jgi:hypothetical protein
MSKALLALYAAEKNYESSAPCYYIFPPLYDYGSVYGITAEIDRAIIGRAPEKILESCNEIQSHLDERLSHVSHISPLRETSRLLKIISSSYRDDGLDSTLKILGLKSLTGKFIHITSALFTVPY